MHRTFNYSLFDILRLIFSDFVDDDEVLIYFLWHKTILPHQKWPNFSQDKARYSNDDAQSC